jgi:hypothetical protein
LLVFALPSLLFQKIDLSDSLVAAVATRGRGWGRSRRKDQQQGNVVDDAEDRVAANDPNAALGEAREA